MDNKINKSQTAINKTGKKSVSPVSAAPKTNVKHKSTDKTYAVKTNKNTASKSANKSVATPAANKAAPKSASAKSAAEVTAPKSATKSTTKSASARATAKNSAKSPAPKKSKTSRLNKINNAKITIIFCVILGGVLALGLSLGLYFGLKGKAEGKPFANNYKSNTLVGYHAEYLGTVKRNIPSGTSFEASFNNPKYPKYGSSLALSNDAQRQIVSESSYLCATPTKNASGSYDQMDAEGNLYLNGNPLGRKLYKHVASVGMYLGDVSDSEPGVIKRITMRPRKYTSYGITGLYAPAGEVIKIQISEADMNATGGITVHIGQALYNGQANNIWVGKGSSMNRMAVILNTMDINKKTATLENGVYTAYVGSYLGGPIYIRNENVNFTTTISGAVNYSHFILGYTTKDEFEKNATSSAPYFDLEVWEYGVLLSGPKRYAQSFSYDQIYDAAVLWEKISLVSTQISKQGVVFLYDSFVAAGAAVAFPGRSSVNCPLGWMSQALNYQSFVTNGTWGNVHEYNHNFQGWGRGDGGEVTNNALSLVSYSLFTKISSARRLGSSNEGLGGWNTYTNASWALRTAINKTDNPLREYAVILHNFGQDAFMQAAVYQRKNGLGQSYSGYCKALSAVTHHNCLYFFKEVLGATISESVENEINSWNYPVFVPVATIYQTGRTYNYNGTTKYIETMQPYVIDYGESFNIDLSSYNAPGGQYKSGSLVLPSGFSYKIKSFTQPENGKITQNGTTLVFTPNKELRSGKIYVTLEITKDDGAFKVDDVQLILEFEQTHERTKFMLNRSTYVYTAEKMYTSPVEAFNNNYAGYSSVNRGNNVNKVQNSNTDVWFTNTEGDMAIVNSVLEISGKIYVSESANYRIALRGRHKAALFVSLDEGQTYQLAVDMENPGSDYNFLEGNYKDFRKNDGYALEAGQWVYFKAVLLVDYEKAFVGVGWGKWEEAQGVMVEKEDGTSEFVEESPARVSVSYATAYRNTYEIIKNKFTGDYFYTRDYKFSYTDQKTLSVKSQCINSSYLPWDDTDTHKIGNLFDDDDNTFIHTNKSNISQENPFEITVKLSKEIYSNGIVFHGSAVKSNYAKYLPKAFKVWISLDGVFWQKVADVTNSSYSNLKVTAGFDKYYHFSYYKVQITDTHSDAAFKYLVLNKIEFIYTISLSSGKLVSCDDEMFTFKGDWEIAQANSYFGHVYKGQKGATLQFEFTGSAFAILTSTGSTAGYNVYVDGVKVSSENIKEVAAGMHCWPTHLTHGLPPQKHYVEIELTSTTSIDSIVIW